MKENNAHANDKTFEQKVWITTGIVALVVLILFFIKTTVNVLLLILAAALIALFFRGLSGLMQRKLHLPPKLSLPLSIVVPLLLLAGFFWLAGSSIQQQADQLSQTLPSAISNFKQQLHQSPIGQRIMNLVSSPNSTQKATQVAQTFFRTSFGVLGDVYVVLFLSIFFTASPHTYVKGFVKLIPLKSRPRAEAVIYKIGDSLTKWLKGQLLAMLVVAVLTLIGLLIMGVPMAFVLALIAGLLNFIPNFGPLIAMVPAVLVGLMQGPTTALLVAGLYLLVQMLESNVITPQIQKKMINTPPALIILAQLFVGVLIGGWGLLLAVPLVVILMVLLEELYIKKQEGRA